MPVVVVVAAVVVVVVGLNTIYSLIVILSSANKYRKHKSSMLNCVLPIDKMIITQTFTMARWQNSCHKVRGNKPNQKQSCCCLCEGWWWVGEGLIALIYNCTGVLGAKHQVTYFSVLFFSFFQL